MSWVQWQGETWEATEDEASLYVHIHAPDTAAPRVEWRWELFHIVCGEKKPDGLDSYVSLMIDDLGFRERDWKRFSDREIVADAAWHEAQENTGAYGRLRSSRVEMTVEKCEDEVPVSRHYEQWRAHDFVMRIGKRDGLTFPFELDAWMIPESEYYRDEPEKEPVPFPSGPPNLRVIAAMVFLGGEVDLPRCGDDPLLLARKTVREETGFDEFKKLTLKWWLRQTPDRAKIVPMPPGWRSSVSFRTQAAKW